MAKILIFVFEISLLILFVASCSKPECKNTNGIFDKYSPDAKEYKDELIKRLNAIDPSKLVYWLEAYWVKGNDKNRQSEYIRVQVQGEGLCAEMVLVIKDSFKGIEESARKKC